MTIQYERLTDLLAAEYGISGALEPLPGENENYLVTTPAGTRFVLKLSGDQGAADLVDLEHAMIERLAQALPDLGLPRIVPTLRGALEATSPDVELKGRLLRYVPGATWCEAGPATEAQRRDLGRLVARITIALADLSHPAAERTHRWDLAAASALRPNVALIEDRLRRRSLEHAFLLYDACARPRLHEMPHSLIHGDLNDENLLVSDGRVCGLLDFGDSLINPTVCELGIALTYAILDEPDPLAAGADIVAGHHELLPLTAREIELLFPLVCGRLAISLATAAERHRLDPERSVWFVTEAWAWSLLERLVEVDPITAAERLAAKTGLAVFPDRTASREEALARRRERISGALSLSFQEPLKISRGRRQYLFDEREQPYLDLYNNVPHVGHCHPHVVEAACRQMSRLNTNTRYLYDELTAYADRLCAALPPQLDHCFVLNSGSEANELALRLARTHTGRKDMLVVEGAYHGHTNTLIDISPYKFLGRGGKGRPEDWVHVVPVPDGYRGAFKGQGRETGVAYGDQVGEVIRASGRPIAGFITESLWSCAGQIIPPAGYLETAFHHVRGAGGVCIIDEVQVGFGRAGTHMWGFELQDVVPDMVVMGKPIGNGHPLAAVVTTSAIAESFAQAGIEFFSTFGGNPVACAVGMAVLDVVRDEKLQENARLVGGRLLAGLQALKDRHPLIGDVRGVGLFIGIELVRDRDTLEPAAEEAAALVDGLRRRHILTGTDGIYHNVVKIKPPMVVTEADADMAVRVIDDLLTETLI